MSERERESECANQIYSTETRRRRRIEPNGSRKYKYINE